MPELVNGAAGPASMSDGGEVSELDRDMAILEDVSEPTSGSDVEDETPSSEGEDETSLPGEEGEDEESPTEEEEEDTEEEPEPEPEAIIPMHSRPSVKDIEAKYPGFFKQFPGMRHALFREKELTALFPTVEDAKEASSNATDFRNFSEMLQSGTPQKFDEFLVGVGQGGPKVLQNMAVNFLPSLFKANRDLYFKVTTPVAASMLRNAFRAAQNSGNKNLENSALHMAQFVLGDGRYASGELKLDDPQPEIQQVDPQTQGERATWLATRYQETRADVVRVTGERLRADISRGLDPNNTLNPTIKGLLVDRIVIEVGAALEKDKHHLGVMNSLWNHAHKASFAGNWKDRLASTYLSGARAVMPAIRSRLRDAAFSNVKTQEGERRNVAEKSGDRREVRGSGTSQQGPRSQQPSTPKSNEIDWDRTSDLDFLNGRITTKRHK